VAPISSWRAPASWVSVFGDIILGVGKYPIFFAERDQENRDTLWIGHTDPPSQSGNSTLNYSLYRCRNSIGWYNMTNNFIQASGLLYLYDESLEKEDIAFIED
jgi:hypothetical protein